MKKLSIVLFAIVLLISCTPEDHCGTITNYMFDCQTAGGQACVYYIWVDGVRHYVNYSTWIEARIGDEICIEY
jgi:hypothetical protein